MAWVYLLRCADGSYYCGSTQNLAQRLHQHSLGLGARYTSRPGRLPVELVWSCETEKVAEAYALEKQIQGWGRAKREALIEGRFADLPALARSGNQQQHGLVVEGDHD